MSRYVPTPGQQAAIDGLRIAGYAVVRQATYDGLKRRVAEVEWENDWQRRDVEHARAWARDCCEQERQMRERLMQVVAGAASLGVSITAINEALLAAHPAPASVGHTEAEEAGK
jgi:hypothetical protein